MCGPRDTQTTVLSICCIYSILSLRFCWCSGSTGLDLSFETHIFLLERIENDRALHNQIVSRAHRIGATRLVEVTLIQVRSKDGFGGLILSNLKWLRLN